MSLYKQHSWSPDVARDEAWMRRRRNRCRERKRRSVTDEDLEDLKACIELGFDFDSPESEIDPRLSDTLPALELYYAVQKGYKDATVFQSRQPSSDGELSPASPVKCPAFIFQPRDKPERLKKQLRHWATAVACTLPRSPRP